jgi:hippurate hydrolase
VSAPENVQVDPALADLYQDLHRHPELGFQERRTSRIVAERLARGGVQVTSGVGQTGVVVNDLAALQETLDAFRDWLGPDNVFDPGAGSGSEDVGILATSAGAPLSYWLLGGADPSLFTTGVMADPALQRVPSNHSPKYAPVLEPTLTLGVTALVTAAHTWLPAA